MTAGNKSVDRKVSNQTPMTVSTRDELGLNRPHSNLHPGIDNSDEISMSGTSFATSIGGHSMSIKEIARAERRAAKQARRELEIALANLPAPQFEYELAAPEAVTDDEDRDVSQRVIDKDAAEVEAEDIARIEKEAAKLYEKRSNVVKRADLPRPVGAIKEKNIYHAFKENKGEDAKETAQKLINEEMLTLLQHDSFIHPFVRPDDDIIESKKSKKDKKGKKKGKSLEFDNIVGPPDKTLQLIEEDALDMAKSMLEEELESVIQEKRSLVANDSNIFQSDEAMKEFLSHQTIQRCIDSAGDVDSETLSSLKDEYNVIQEGILAIRKRANKLESKISVKNGGYIKRSTTMLDSIHKDFEDFQNSTIEERVFLSLRKHEERGITNRVEKLLEEIERLDEQEALLQKKYGDLLHERNRHKILMRQKEAVGNDPITK